MHPQQQTRGKWAIFGLMFIPGFTWASWVSRTPFMRDVLHASTEMMGLTSVWLLLWLHAGRAAGR